ncbi:anthranilate synthase component I family protein [Fulvivirga lutea]|uniref:Anthranilate synthase component I family protein n=1 Tax=Fulvivirga lutea TaxID=2810512 RepID=A0A974WEA1_9BACT|nr:anthranilate synthase component I family protein [Fulvivirga lutea]QSE96734.1 anthranilate synthase component I family protein [Fulvivirga lutea]
MKTKQEFQLPKNNLKGFIHQALSWASGFEHFTYFNPNNYTFPHNPFEHILLVGDSLLNISSGSSFENLQQKLTNRSYLAGHFSYDLKNEIEKLMSNNQRLIDSAETSFFKATTIITFRGESIQIETEADPLIILKEIQQSAQDHHPQPSIQFEQLVSKSEYIQTAKKLINHIIEGDIYEINYCIPFLSESCKIDPIQTYLLLCEKYPAPFSVLYKNKNQYVISGSPERFLKKEGNKLISQPIKGTAKRGATNEEDELIKKELRANKKELAENMMIVDLVRNDLARSCKPGSVKVEEMFGIYSFPLWHQMISTVTGLLKPDTDTIQAIKNAFPMGSMTGAPKIKVMELAEQYEITKRGIYSGAIGYIKPNGDFDFNVVIRSLIYDQETETCTFHVGSAITYDSDPASEYDECLLKAKTLISLF